MRILIDEIMNNDGSQRFLHTYVYLWEEGKPKKLCFINDIGLTYVSFSSYKIIEKDSFAYIETIMPHIQWVQLEDNRAALLERTPSKQWKRSLSNGTHSFYFPAEGKNCPSYNVGLSHFGTNNIDALLNHKVIDFKEALENVVNYKNRDFAFSTHFMIDKRCYIYLGKSKIAKILPSLSKYKVHSLFAEELRDLTKGMNMKESITDVSFN